MEGTRDPRRALVGHDRQETRWQDFKPDPEAENYQETIIYCNVDVTEGPRVQVEVGRALAEALDKVYSIT